MTACGVIFDADGVLFDSERQSLDALLRAVEEATDGEVRLPPDQHEFYCGRGDDEILDYVAREFGHRIDPERFRDIKLDCYRRAITDHPIAVATGAGELLAQLEAERIAFAVATGAVRPKLDLSLAAVGWSGRFRVITSADDVEAGKPDPAIFLRSAERLGIAPIRLAVFEDSLNGVIAANCAGMFSVAVAGTFPRERLSEARKVIDSLAEVTVPALVGWLNSHGRNPAEKE
jgi:HAD superfamily hydrolase (TIGR01509 family)